MSRLMKLSKHGFLLANDKGEETDVPFAELLQAQVADLTQAVDEASDQAGKLARDGRIDVTSRRERLRTVAERGGHRVRRLAREHRQQLLQAGGSDSTSACQGTLSLFDHNVGRAEQILAAIGKGSG